MPALIESLINALGGNSYKGGDINTNPDTGEVKYNPEVLNHPFWSKLSGKADQVEKLNQMLRIYEAQTNSKIGQSRLEHSQSEDTRNQDVNRHLLDRTGQPVNTHTKSMLEEFASNPGVISAIQKEAEAMSGANTATAGATQSGANVTKKKSDIEFNDLQNNPETYMNNLRASIAKSLGVTLGQGDILGGYQPNGTVRKIGQGTMAGGEHQTTMPIKGPDGKIMNYPIGAPIRDAATPGNFNPNIKNLLDKAPTSSGSPLLNSSVLTQGINNDPFVGGFGNLSALPPTNSIPATSTSSPQALGIKSQSDVLSGQAGLMMLLKKLGGGISSMYPQSALQQ